MKLLNGRNATRAFQKLSDAATPGGAMVERRGRGWSDYDVVLGLVRDGLIESFPGGPSGGARWRVTAAGRVALNEARTRLEWLKTGGPEVEKAARKLARQIDRRLKIGNLAAQPQPARIERGRGL